MRDPSESDHTVKKVWACLVSTQTCHVAKPNHIGGQSWQNELGTKAQNQELQALPECFKQVAEPIPAINTKPGTDQGTSRNHSEWTQVLYLLLKITGNQVHQYMSCIIVESTAISHW